MSEPYRFVTIEDPRDGGLPAWHGIVRHRVDAYWVDGIFQTDTSIDVWERREPTFVRGDRVVVNEGMGNYALATYIGMTPQHMAELMYDGYIEPDGTQHEPYELQIAFRVLSKADPYLDEHDEEHMIEGYHRIKAVLD